MITDITLRISGIVSFSNGTHQKFLAAHEDGSLINPMSADSLEAFKQLWAEKRVTINALFNSLGATHTITTSAPASDLVVTDWTLHFTGRISRSDNTSGNFSAIWDAKGGSRIEGASVYAEVKADSTYNAKVDALLEVPAGTGKVAIA